MIQTKLYAETPRYDEAIGRWQLTEKLDGGNLCLLKGDHKRRELLVATRNRVFTLEEALSDAHRKTLYKGLAPWLEEHAGELLDQMIPTRALCGEWLGMGTLKYPDMRTPDFRMFAAARWTRDADGAPRLEDKTFWAPNFASAFMSAKLPDFLKTVPVVRTGRLDSLPGVGELDDLYEEYSRNSGRPVEGFVLSYRTLEGTSKIFKYVRMKRGAMAPHRV